MGWRSSKAEILLDLVDQAGAELLAPAMGRDDGFAAAQAGDLVAALAGLEGAALFREPASELVGVNIDPLGVPFR